MSKASRAEPHDFNFYCKTQDDGHGSRMALKDAAHCHKILEIQNKFFASIFPYERPQKNISF
jgi:hypothetical protein